MAISKINLLVLLFSVVTLFSNASLAAPRSSVIGPDSGCVEPFPLPTTGSSFSSVNTTNFGAPFELQVFRGACVNNDDLLTYVRIVPDDQFLPVSLCSSDFDVNFDGSLFTGFQFVSEFSITPPPACQTVSTPKTFILDQSTAFATFDSNLAFTLLYSSIQSESASVDVPKANGTPVAHVENSSVLGLIVDSDVAVCFNNDGSLASSSECDGTSQDEGYVSIDSSGNWVGGGLSQIKNCGVSFVSAVSNATCTTTNSNFATCENNNYTLIQTTKSNHYFAIKANAQCTGIATPDATGITPCRTTDSFDSTTGCMAAAPTPVAHVENSSVLGLIVDSDEAVCFNNDGSLASSSECNGGSNDEGYVSLDSSGNWAGGGLSQIKSCGVSSISAVSNATCTATGSNFATCENNNYTLIQTTKSNHFFAIKANAQCTGIATPDATGITPCRTTDSFDSTTGCTAAASPADGSSLYGTHCSSCHGVGSATTKAGATVARINTGIATVAAMNSLGTTLSASDIQAIADYLATINTTPPPTGGAVPTTGTLDADIKMLAVPFDGSEISGIATINGYATAPTGINEVKLYIDDEFISNLPYGEIRSGVQNLYPNYSNSLNSGYSFPYFFSLLSEGQHTIQIVAIDNAGNYNILSNTVTTTKYSGGYILSKDVNLSTVSSLAMPSGSSSSFILKDISIKGALHDVEFTFDQSSQNFNVTSVCNSIQKELCTIDAVPAATLLLP